MTKLALIIAATLAAPAHAEVYPLNIFRRIGAAFAGPYYYQRAKALEPIVRPRRVPLMDVRPCEDDGCVIVNGRKIALEPTPADLMHGRVEVVGQAKQKGHVGLFARVRFGSWGSTEPDYLLLWAAIRERDHRVKLLGYTVQRDEQPGTESETRAAVRNAALYKFLTSENPVEVEIARELTERDIFCLKYPAEPADVIRDEVSHLEAHDLIHGETPRMRLEELNALASLINAERGRSRCESPVTDQMDNVLDQAREALQGFVNQRSKKPEPKPAEAVKPEAPKAEPAPTPAPAPEVLPGVHPGA